MNLDQRLTEAVRRVADEVLPPEVDLDSVRGQARARQRRTAAVVVVAVVTAAVVTAAALSAGPNRGEPPPPEPVRPPQIIGSGPVWYDAVGLHRGDVVEETAVDLFADAEGNGALALVRGGALYLDPATGDVWFHPWQGKPRVIGHESSEGPGGDPHGDVAVWFEGNALVAYDTALGREIVRTPPDHSDAAAVPYDTLMGPWSEHVAGGNGFMHVSARQVVWRSDFGVHRLDLTTGDARTLWKGSIGDRPTFLEDVHGRTRVWGGGRGGLSIVGPRQEALRFPGLEPIGRLNADGAHVLAPSGTRNTHGATIVDLRSGDAWTLPQDDIYAWFAWSYGDVALVLADRDGEESLLLSCDAATRECATLPHEGTVLLPTS